MASTVVARGMAPKLRPMPAVRNFRGVTATIDLNADVGESYGRWEIGDAGLLAVVTSASVACGFHAGDPVVMMRTVREAAERGVTIGAHPGYPDLLGFGRRDLAASPTEIEAYILYQIGALEAVCRAAGTRVRYVKPHGALYNRAARDPATANAVASAVRTAGRDIALLGLAGSELVRAAERAGIRAVREAFVDRGYRSDGTLVPRGAPGSLLDDPRDAAERALAIVRDGLVRSVDGVDVQLEADSLCTHGDGARAAEMCRAVRERLESGGIRVAAFA